MINKLKQIFTQRVRAYIYRVSTVGLLALAAYGYIDQSQVEVWNLVAAAVTGISAANTPTRESYHQE